MKILLFDIDGTLLDSGGAGKRALNHSFGEICSINNALDGLRLAGKTDPLIIRETLENNSVAMTDGLTRKLKRSYLKHLEKEIENADKKLKPGVAKLLKTLAKTYKNHLGLLTGNFSEGADIKLKSLEISSFFSFGAYGGDDEDRNKLLPHAQRRYKQFTGHDVSTEQFVVIGDTPRDVACAKPYNARSIAVATGPHSQEELLAAGADIVLPNLTDTKGFLELIR